MPSIDMPLEQCRQYRPALNREADFDAFWNETREQSRQQPLRAEFTPVDIPARGVQSYAVRYDGFEGGRIAGWYVRPAGSGKFPGIVMYHGYSGRGTRPLDMLQYVYQGFAVMSMDCRGQNGESEDAKVYPAGHYSGWMTLGVRSPRDYYYRYVYMDAVRALELLAGREEVDETRLGVTGGSQGGGITIAVAALAADRVKLAMPDIPFLCDFRRSVQITPEGPYPEIAKFLKSQPHLVEQTYRTLSYCDGLNLAPWIKARTLMSLGLWDNVCAPSTIFGTYNHIPAEKRIEIFPYAAHEVPYEHAELKLRTAVETLQP